MIIKIPLIGKVLIKRLEEQELPSVDIGNILAEIDTEIMIACRALYAWKAIHNLASSDPVIKAALNTNAETWNPILHSLQATYIVAIGRIFDLDARSCTIHLLFRTCQKNIDQFNRENHKKRYMDGKSEEPDFLENRLNGLHIPVKRDFRNLKKKATRVQHLYETKYKPIRNQLFAHKDSGVLSDPGILFVGTKIDDIQDILSTLYKVQRCINALYVNGHKFDFDYWELNEEEIIRDDVESLLRKL